MNARPSILALVAMAALGACADGPDESMPDADGSAVATAPARSTAQWADQDWDIFTNKVEWAEAMGLDTLPLGEAMARLGQTFVGTDYVPGTLDPEGDERLVINFHGLDCVTFVENVLSLTRFVQGGGPELMSDPEAAKARYEQLLAEVRYRNGELAGYPSRLHYFTDWIADAEAKGLVHNVTRELGGEADSEPIDFMTTHTDSYRHLADTANVALIRQAEARLNGAPRWYIPQADIPQAVDGIQDGDIIAATSSVEGLDIAHTGLALWKDGKLHLMHAPLVGKDVQVSEVPLADRILDISGQDGIMVARPVDPRGTAGH